MIYETKELKTKRLLLKVPTMDEQYALWNILKDENLNKYYFPTPNRIFIKNNLSKDNITDLIKAREIFLLQLNDWERQKPFYESKIEKINNKDNNQIFTWSIFLNDEVIGQITVQPKDELNDPKIRDIGWFIAPKYQKMGYGSEAAEIVLKYMFNEVGIDRIITSAAQINEGSWKLMEKLGFIRTSEGISPYFDEKGNILPSYNYELDKKEYYGNNRV